MRTLIPSTVCALLWMAAPIQAQTAPELLDLSVDRNLTQSDLKILSQIIDQNSVTDITRSLGDDAPTLNDACGDNTFCIQTARDRFDSAEAIANALPERPDPSGTLGWTGNVMIDRPQLGLPGGGIVISNVAPSSGVPDLRAVPIEMFGTDALRYTGDDTISAFIAPISPPAQLIEADIARFGSSRRTFAIRPDVNNAELTAAIAALNQPGLEASRLADDAEPPASLIEPLDVVTFEAAPDAVDMCARDAEGRPWPFDAVPVVDVLRDNLRVMANLKLPIARALIVVADTGLGKGVLEAGDGGFFDILAPNAPELLNPLVTYRLGNGLPGSTTCTDHDHNGYFADVFGAVGSDLNVMDRCLETTGSQAFDPRLIPISRRVGAIETYEPSHGSFVATLAAGGVDLLHAYPEISQQIGLRIFRTTRETEQTSTKSVRVDPTDIIGAIKYAIAQHAAVLNMSMKTTDDLGKLFKDEVDKADILVVVSAGNRAENLDQPANGVFPAGLTSDHLIVVGGLENDAGHSWWANSATGKGHVEIAAPAVRVRSLDENGKSVCYTGTSAAAPVVSFTGAVLLSYGVFDARGAKIRILGAATMEPEGSLNGNVTNGRRLDVAGALDIFSDRLTTATGTVRGRILSHAPSARLLSICAPTDPALAATGGLMDPANLVSWSRSGDQATFALVRRESDLGHCQVPQDVSIPFQKIGSTNAVQIPLEEITSIVFSSFRSDEVQNAVLLED